MLACIITAILVGSIDSVDFVNKSVDEEAKEIVITSKSAGRARNQNDDNGENRVAEGSILIGQQKHERVCKARQAADKLMGRSEITAKQGRGTDYMSLGLQDIGNE